MLVSALPLIAVDLLLLSRMIVATQEVEEIQTINYKDSDGFEHVELAFRPPMEGVPQHALDVFCASTKMRLYWGVFREEIKESHNKGIHLRRAARMAKHVFSDVRDADKPFNATMLSQVDKWLPAKFDSDISEQDAGSGDEKDESSAEGETKRAKNLGGKIAAASKKINNLKTKLTRQKSCAEESGKNSKKPASDSGDNNGETTLTQEQLDLLDTSETNQIDDIDANKVGEVKKQLKSFLKKWSPKVALSIYTRWRTLWWLMLSCLFTKYYLWDPALDEFTKLKRNLVMWPELQLVKLKELQCKPVQLFKRILDSCKILNPLLNINFGTLSLDKPTRFKGDIN